MILPIVVHSAASNPSYVSRGITDMISSRLEQTGRVQRGARRGSRARPPRSSARRSSWGKARGGDYLIFGAFTQFGDGASLDVHCLPLNVSNEAEAAAARRIFIQSGAMGDIIPKLDEIVDRVAMYTKVGARRERGRSGAAGAAAPLRRRADVLRDLVRRLDALEKAVFKGGAPRRGRREHRGAGSGAAARVVGRASRYRRAGAV